MRTGDIPWKRPEGDEMGEWDGSSLSAARILIVDDEEANVHLLEVILRKAGYGECRSTTDPRDVATLLTEFEPDLMLLDLSMPHLDGFAVMEQVEGATPEGSYVPILVLTADMSPEVRRRALAGGGKDFLTKPFDVDEVLLRIGNMLEVRGLHVQLQGQNRMLEERVRERTRDLEQAHIETFERLALAAEYRDDDTGQHTLRVGLTAALVARELKLSNTDVAMIERAAGLHDVGKIGVPDAILLKPGKLTPEEFEIVKTHTTIGAKVLSGSRSPLLQLAEEIAWAHHERWDGTGYGGMVGEEIPLSGRITAVADVFDALTHERPYKHAWPVEDALIEITDQSGRQFDPQVVEAFESVQKEAGRLALMSGPIGDTGIGRSMWTPEKTGAHRSLASSREPAQPRS